MVGELGDPPGDEIRDNIEFFGSALQSGDKLSKWELNYFLSSKCGQVLVFLKFLYFLLKIILRSLWKSMNSVLPSSEFC